MALQSMIRILSSKLQEAEPDATSVVIDVGLLKTAVDYMKESENLQYALDQAQEQLSLKPSVAKKLADKIKQLESDLETLRSNSRVTELEKKLQILQAELKQSYATKNFALKSGMLDLEKKHRSLIYGNELVQDLWMDLTWLMTEDKESLPAEHKARRSQKLTDSGVATVPGSPVVPVALGVAALIDKLPDDGAVWPAPAHATTSSAHLPRARPSLAPTQRGIAGADQRMVRVRSVSESGTTGPLFAPHPQAASSRGADYLADGLTTSAAAGLAAVARQAFASNAAMCLPGVPQSTQKMLRPVSLHHEVYGPIDASSTEHPADSMAVSLLQLRELFHGFTYFPTSNDSVVGQAGSGRDEGGGDWPAPAPRIDASAFDQQVDQLKSSVEQLRTMYVGGAPVAPSGDLAGGIGSGLDDSAAAMRDVSPDARYFESQADAVLASIDHLQRMYQQYAGVADTVPLPGGTWSGVGSSSTAATTAAGHHEMVPDARYFDDHLIQLAASLQHMRSLLPPRLSRLPGASGGQPGQYGGHYWGHTASGAAAGSGGVGVLPVADVSHQALHENAQVLFGSLMELRSRFDTLPASLSDSSARSAHGADGSDSLVGNTDSARQDDGGTAGGTRVPLVDASTLDQQAEDLRTSVSELRHKVLTGLPSGPHIPGQPSMPPVLTPDVRYFDAQAETALSSIQDLQRLYRQYVAPASTAAGGADGGALSQAAAAAAGTGDPAADASRFDGQLQALATSLQHIRAMVPDVIEHQQLTRPAGDTATATVPPGALATLASHFLVSLASSSSGGAASSDVAAGISGEASLRCIEHDRADGTSTAGANAVEGGVTVAGPSHEAQSVEELSRRFGEYLQAAAQASGGRVSLADVAAACGFTEAQLTEAHDVMVTSRLLPPPSSDASVKASSSDDAAVVPPVDGLVTLFSHMLSELQAQDKLSALLSRSSAAAAGGGGGGRAAATTDVAATSDCEAHNLLDLTSTSTAAAGAGGGTTVAHMAASSPHGDDSSAVGIAHEEAFQGDRSKQREPGAAASQHAEHAASSAVAPHDVVSAFEECLLALQAAEPDLVSGHLALPGATAGGTALPGGKDTGGADEAHGVVGTPAASGPPLDRSTAATTETEPLGQDGPSVSGWPFSSTAADSWTPLPVRSVITSGPLAAQAGQYGLQAGQYADQQTPGAASGTVTRVSAADQVIAQQQATMRRVLQRVSAKHATLLAADCDAAELWHDVEEALAASGVLPTDASSSVPQSGTPGTPAPSNGSFGAAMYAGLLGGISPYHVAPVAASRTSSAHVGALTEGESTLSRTSSPKTVLPPQASWSDFTKMRDAALGDRVTPAVGADKDKSAKELQEQVAAYAHTIHQLSSKLEQAINRADDADFLFMQKSTDLRRAERALEQLQQESMNWRLELIDVKIRMAETSEDQLRMVKKIAQSSSEQKMLVEIEEDLRGLVNSVKHHQQQEILEARAASLQPPESPFNDALLLGLNRIMRRVRTASTGGGSDDNDSEVDQQQPILLSPVDSGGFRPRLTHSTSNVASAISSFIGGSGGKSAVKGTMSFGRHPAPPPAAAQRAGGTPGSTGGTSATEQISKALKSPLAVFAPFGSTPEAPRGGMFSGGRTGTLQGPEGLHDIDLT